MRALWAEFLSVTEAAAASVVPLVGSGRKEAADQAAVDGMRRAFDGAMLRGRIVIGEGEMDEAPMLYIGEEIGHGQLACDIAVDPLEGTGLTADGQPGAVTVLAAGPRDTLLHAPDIYMEKICAGPAARGQLDLDAPIETNIDRLARSLGRRPVEIVAAVLDRPRHRDLIDRLRRKGVQVHLLPAGDLAPAVVSCLPGGEIDLVAGIGGAPEGVITACAVRALGGEFIARMAPSDDEETRRLHAMGGDEKKVLCLDDVVRSEDVVFAATCVTGGLLGPGPRREERWLTLHSVIVDREGVRRVARTMQVLGPQPS